MLPAWMIAPDAICFAAAVAYLIAYLYVGAEEVICDRPDAPHRDD